MVQYLLDFIHIGSEANKENTLRKPYAEIWHLRRQPRDSHIQKLIKGGVHPGH